MAWKLKDTLEPDFDGGLIRNKFLKGGMFTVKTRTQRNTAIKYLHRELDGERTTLCFVSGDNAVYELISNPSSGGTTDQDWKRLNFGVSDILIVKGTWDADNTTPVLQDSSALANGNDFYIVTGAPTPIQVQYSGLFGGQQVTVVDGNWIISNGTEWFVSPSPLNWDSISNVPTVLNDYVLGTIIAHTHEMTDVSGLVSALSLKFDLSNVADHGTAYGSIPDTKLIDKYTLDNNFYQKSELYTQTEITTLLSNFTKLTTKGDLLGHNGTIYSRLAVGADGQLLSADAASPLGLKWIPITEAIIPNELNAWYVDEVNGDDTNGNGSRWSPFATFEKAHTEASTGDTIFISGTTSTVAAFDITKSVNIKATRTDNYSPQNNATLNIGGTGILTVTGWANFSDIAIIGSVVSNNNNDWIPVFENCYIDGDFTTQYACHAFLKDSRLTGNFNAGGDGTRIQNSIIDGNLIIDDNIRVFESTILGNAVVNAISYFYNSNINGSASGSSTINMYNSTVTGANTVATINDDHPSGGGGPDVGTWYVNQSGNDTTGDGSAQRPYATIQKAHDEAAADDIILVNAGTYTSLTTTKNIAVIALSRYNVFGDGAAQVTITTCTIGSTFKANLQGVRIDDLRGPGSIVIKDCYVANITTSPPEEFYAHESWIFGAAVGLSTAGDAYFWNCEVQPAITAYRIQGTCTHFQSNVTSTTAAITLKQSSVKGNVSAGSNLILYGGNSIGGSITVSAPGTITFTDPKEVGVWYVDPSGNDKFNGSQIYPFLTITKAISVASAGDTIYIAAGGYAEAVTLNKQVRLVGETQPANNGGGFPPELQTTINSLTINANGAGASGINITGNCVLSDPSAFDVMGLMDCYIGGNLIATGSTGLLFVEFRDVIIAGTVTLLGGQCYSYFHDVEIGSNVSITSSPDVRFTNSQIKGSLQLTTNPTVLMWNSHIQTLNSFTSGTLSLYQTGIYANNHVGAGTLNDFNPWNPTVEMANIWYVDSINGDNGNNGGLTTPFQTLAAAVSAATSGDIVIVLNGVFNGSGVTKDLTIICNEGVECTGFSASTGSNPVTITIVGARLDAGYSRSSGTNPFTLKLKNCTSELTNSSFDVQNLEIYNSKIAITGTTARTYTGLIISNSTVDFGATDITPTTADLFNSSLICDLLGTGTINLVKSIHKGSRAGTLTINNITPDKEYEEVISVSTNQTVYLDEHPNSLVIVSSTAICTVGLRGTPSSDDLPVGSFLDVIDIGSATVGINCNASSGGSIVGEYPSIGGGKANLKNVINRAIYQGSDVYIVDYPTLGDLEPAVWYVNKNGSDTFGTGSPTKPFLTVGAAVSASSDGDTIFISKGDYSTENITTAKHLTLIGIDGDPNLLSITGDRAQIGAITLQDGCDFFQIKGMHTGNITMQTQTTSCGLGVANSYTGTITVGTNCYLAGRNSFISSVSCTEYAELDNVLMNALTVTATGTAYVRECHLETTLSVSSGGTLYIYDSWVREFAATPNGSVIYWYNSKLYVPLDRSLSTNMNVNFLAACSGEFPLEVVLTATQVQGLNTTPITIVDAPGTDIYIRVKNPYAFLNRVISSFSGGTTMFLKDSGGSTRWTSSSSFINTGSDRREQWASSGAVAILTNTALQISADADSTGGSGATVTVQFSIEFETLD